MLLGRFDLTFYRPSFHNWTNVVFSSVTTVSRAFMTCNVAAATCNAALQIKITDDVPCLQEVGLGSTGVYICLKNLCRPTNFSGKVNFVTEVCL